VRETGACRWPTEDQERNVQLPRARASELQHLPLRTGVQGTSSASGARRRLHVERQALCQTLSAPTCLAGGRTSPQLLANRATRAARPNSGRLEPTNGSALQGLWWEWQWSGPAGWTCFDLGSSEKLEEAFTLGETICCLGHHGVYQYFDLSTGREVNGPLRIRRVRMPSHEREGHSASTCSTFLVSTDLEHQASTSTWADVDALGSVGPFCSRAPMGDDSVLQGSQLDVVAHLRLQNMDSQNVEDLVICERQLASKGESAEHHVL